MTATSTVENDRAAVDAARPRRLTRSISSSDRRRRGLSGRGLAAAVGCALAVTVGSGLTVRPAPAAGAILPSLPLPTLPLGSLGLGSLALPPLESLLPTLPLPTPRPLPSVMPTLPPVPSVVPTLPLPSPRPTPSPSPSTRSSDPSSPPSVSPEPSLEATPSPSGGAAAGPLDPPSSPRIPDAGGGETPAEGPLEWLGEVGLPGLAIGTSVVLLAVVILAQLLGGAIWLPIIRRALGGVGVRGPGASPDPADPGPARG